MIDHCMHCALFRHCSEDDVRTLLALTHAQQTHAEKDQILLHAGDVTHHIGLVLSGCIHIVSYDMLGNCTLMSSVMPGHVFAEVYACMPGEKLMVYAIAAQPSDVLLLDASFLHASDVMQPCQIQFLRNLLSVTAQKSLMLSQRMLHTSPKTIRGRLLNYLSDLVVQQHSSSLTLPFNRQQLADYLGVDRSALSAEMSAMQREGLIHFHRSQVEVLCSNDLL